MKSERNEKTGKIEESGRTEETGRIGKTKETDRAGKTESTIEIERTEKTERNGWERLIRIFLAGTAFWLFLLYMGTGVFAGTDPGRPMKKSITITVGRKASLQLRGGKAHTVWRSSAPKVATVLRSSRKRAVLLAQKCGRAVITAQCGKKKYRCKVTVTGRSKPYLSVNRMTITAKKSKMLTVKDAGRITSYESSDPKIAQISRTERKGRFLVYADASSIPGKTKIIIRADGKTLSCEVRVRPSGTWNRTEQYDPAFYLTEDKRKELARYGINKTGIVGGLRHNVAVSSDCFLKADGTYAKRYVSVTPNDGRKIGEIVYGVTFSGNRIRTVNIEDRDNHLRDESPESITDTGIRFEFGPVYGKSAPEAKRIQIDPKKVRITNRTPQLITIREDTWNNSRAAAGLPSENPDNRHSAVFRIFCRNRTGMARFDTYYRGLVYHSRIRLIQEALPGSGWKLKAEGGTTLQEGDHDLQKCSECGAVWEKE